MKQWISIKKDLMKSSQGLENESYKSLTKTYNYVYAKSVPKNGGIVFDYYILAYFLAKLFFYSTGIKNNSLSKKEYYINVLLVY